MSQTPNDGNTPLTSAILQRDSNKVSQLLFNGANPNQPRTLEDEEPYSLQQALSFQPQTYSFGQMLQRKPEEEEIYPLALALVLNEDKIFLNLLANWANPDFIMENGETPLTYSIKNNKSPFIAMLFLYGANPQIKNTEGKDAFTLAQGNTKVLEMLEKTIKQKGPLPAKHTHWQSYCNYLSSFKYRELRQIAKLLGLKNYSNLTKADICSRLEDLFADYLIDTSYSHNNLPCRNKKNEFGREFDTIEKDYFIIDEDQYCLQLPVIEEALRKDGRNPFSGKNLRTEKSLDGQNLLSLYNQIPSDIKKKADYEYKLDKVNQYI